MFLYFAEELIAADFFLCLILYITMTLHIKEDFSPIFVGVPSAYIFFYLSFNSKSNYEKGHKPPF